MTVDDLHNNYAGKVFEGKYSPYFSNDYVEWLEQQLLEAREESERLKCCGNCKLVDACLDFDAILDSKRICESKWQSDNLTRKEREV